MVWAHTHSSHYQEQHLGDKLRRGATTNSWPVSVWSAASWKRGASECIVVWWWGWFPLQFFWSLKCTIITMMTRRRRKRKKETQLIQWIHCNIIILDTFQTLTAYEYDCLDSLVYNFIPLSSVWGQYSSFVLVKKPVKIQCMLRTLWRKLLLWFGWSSKWRCWISAAVVAADVCLSHCETEGFVRERRRRGGGVPSW